MEDCPGFNIVPSQPFVATPLEPNELFRGAWWPVYLQNGRFEFNYLSGHMAGFEQRFSSQEEAGRLIAGELDPEQLLLAYGAD